MTSEKSVPQTQNSDNMCDIWLKYTDKIFSNNQQNLTVK